MLPITVSLLLVSCDKDDKPVEDKTDDVVLQAIKSETVSRNLKLKRHTH